MTRSRLESAPCRHDRSANRAAELLALRVGLGKVALLREVILRRPVRVLSKSERTAVEDIGSRLGDRIDDRARGAAELRVELIGDDLELLDGLDGRPRLRPGALADDVVVVVAAVQHVLLLLRSPPLTEIESGEGFGADTRDDSGSSPMKPMKLRLIDGGSTISLPVRLPPTLTTSIAVTRPRR